jgi:hypothetical protein
VASAALALAPIYKGDYSIMAYNDRLKPWVVVRLLPTLQWVTISRYKNRSDAEGHLRLFRQRIPNYRFEVVFDLSDRTNIAPGD